MGWEEVRGYLPGSPGSGLAVIEVNFDDTPPRPAGPYLVRLGRTRLGEQVAQRVLIDADDEQARHRLGVEVEIGEHLWRSWPVTHYPDQLCLLLCSSLDANPPFVLLTQRGEPLPAAGVEPRIEGRQATAIVNGVITGLLRLHQAGVVCRAISPETLLWSGEGNAMQFAYFGEAAFHRRELNGPVSAAPLPWRAPDPGPGLARLANTQDDVYSGALVLFWLLTGERPDRWYDPPLTDPGLIADAVRDRLEPETRLTRFDESVRNLLHGAFGRSAADRVDAPALAQNLGAFGLPRPGVIISKDWDRTAPDATRGYRTEYHALLTLQEAFLASRPPVRPVPDGQPRAANSPVTPPSGRTRHSVPIRRPARFTLTSGRTIIIGAGVVVIIVLAIVIGVVIP